MRVLLVGVGGRGREHLDALRHATDVTVVGAVDPDPKARQAARALGLPAFGALDAAANLAPDYVVVATPPAPRLALVEQLLVWPGLRAIAVEKPMAASWPEARQMLARCDAAGVLLLVSHQLRYDAAFMDVYEAIAAGRLGSVRHLVAECYGNLANQGPHMLDAVRWLNGEEAVWVWAAACDQPRALAPLSPQGYWRDPHHPAPMWLTAVIGLASGGRAFVNCGLLHQAVAPDDGPWLQKRVVAVGDAGVAEARVAGWSRLSAAGLAAPEECRYTPADYRDATHRFHLAVATMLAGGEPHQCLAADAVKSYELQLACEQSLASGAPVAMPLKDRGPVADTADPSSPCQVSVIVALPDHRGYAARCVRSWTTGQELAADQFEVILVAGAADAVLARQLQPWLRPGDQLLVGPDEHELALYHRGAQAARGRVLLFSEPHCLAEPQCLRELVEYLADHPVDGCCLRSTALCPNRLATMESRLYDEGFAAWAQPDSWSKVIIRGFAVYRHVYHHVGGFATRYDRFSEWLLGVALHQSGHRLGYAAGASVAHVYTDSLRALVPFITSFTVGECRYRRDADPATVTRYFGSPAEWGQDRLYDRQLTGQLARLLGSRAVWGWHHGRGWAGRTAVLRGCLRYALLACGGVAWLALAARLNTWSAAGRTHFWRWLSEARCYRAYTEFYAACTRQARVEFIAREPAAAVALDLRGRQAVSALPDAALVGFHARERALGREFRWTGVVAALCLAAPGAEVVVELHGFARDFGACGVAAWLGRRPLEPDRFQAEEQRLVLRLSPQLWNGPSAWLALQCLPMRGVGDPRELGLALTAMECSGAA